MITIRKMLQSDEHPVSDIVSQCWRFIAKPDRITDDQLNRMLVERCLPEHMAAIRSRFSCSVAEVAGTVVGCIAVSANSVEELWVLPAYHRRGIGTVLLREAEQSARNTGHRKMIVSTTGYGRPFYEAMGMQIAGTKLVTFGPLEGRALTVLEKEL